MRTKLFNELDRIQYRSPEIRKTFKFTMEALQDRPCECLDIIESYLIDNKPNIRDYWIEDTIDEDTMSPVLIFHITPSDEIASYCKPSLAYLKLMQNCDNYLWKIKQFNTDLNKFLTEKYLHEMNSKQVRRDIARDIESFIAEHFKIDVQVLDTAKPQDVDKNVTQMKVFYDNEIFYVDEFIEYIYKNNRI